MVIVSLPKISTTLTAILRYPGVHYERRFSTPANGLFCAEKLPLVFKKYNRLSDQCGSAVFHQVVPTLFFPITTSHDWPLRPRCRKQ